MMGMSPADVTAEIHGFSYPDATPVPWSVGLDHVVAAETFWLSTARSDGRPHVTPLIAVWHGDGIWFTTGPDEQKARNLAANPMCALTAGRRDLVDGGLDVVLEGVAEQITNQSMLQAVAEAFEAKYGTELWDFVVRDGGFAHRGSDGLVLHFAISVQLAERVMPYVLRSPAPPRLLHGWKCRVVSTPSSPGLLSDTVAIRRQTWKPAPS